MTKIKWSKFPEEWYCSYGICCNCNTEFMCSKAHYCPGCGEKIEKEEVSSEGTLLVDQYNHIEGKKVPLIHTDKEKHLIEEANQRIRKSQVEQAKGAIRSANFIAK